MNRQRIFILCILAMPLTGCQQPGAGQRQALFDFSQPPKVFQFGQNQTGGSAFGSTNGPLANSNNTSPWSNLNQSANEWANGLSDQLQSLNKRLNQFDYDNQQLLTEMAALKQKLQAASDFNYQLKQQLADSVGQIQQLQNEKRNLEQQLAGATVGNPMGSQFASGGNGVPAQLPGNVSLRANNSLMQKLPQLQMPGVSARMDGDVIRVELSSDQLFQTGSYQINPQHGQHLQQLAMAINREFPRQIVGIESHWDGSEIQPATTSHHQLTATQALAVYNYFVRLGMPERQLFTMSMGNNRPRYSSPDGMPNASNRRIEIVIYPESFDAN